MTRRSSLAAAFLAPLLGLAVLGLTIPRQSRQEQAVLGDWSSWSTAPWRALPGKPTHPPQAVVIAAVLCLVLFWLLVMWTLLRTSTHMRRPWFAATVVAWVAPFALAAPSFSRDLYSYVAQGELMRRGLDPYAHPVAALGPGSSVLSAADPTWRSSLTPYGPLALRLEQLAAASGGHDELAALIFLRLVSLLCLIGLVALVRRSVHPERQDLATWLVCSPLLLVHGLSPAHLDMPVSLLLLCAAQLAQRRKLVPAAVLIVLAGEIKATALVALVVLAVHALAVGRGATVRTLAATVATLAASCLLYVHDPFGWVSALSTPTSHWDPYTPWSVLLLAVGEARHHAQLLGPSGVGPVLRSAAAIGGGTIAVWMLARSRRAAAGTFGMVTLVVFLSAPVVWPWYLLPCAALLLLGGGKDWILSCALGAFGALVALPIGVVPGQRVALLASVAAGALAWSLGRSAGFVARLEASGEAAQLSPADPRAEGSLSPAGTGDQPGRTAPRASAGVPDRVDG